MSKRRRTKFYKVRMGGPNRGTGGQPFFLVVRGLAYLKQTGVRVKGPLINAVPVDGSQAVSWPTSGTFGSSRSSQMARVNTILRSGGQQNTSTGGRRRGVCAMRPLQTIIFLIKM
jgi:hypothetical protein